MRLILFEKEIAEVVHETGGLLYYDGANTNAMMGKCTPGAMGVHIVHWTFINDRHKVHTVVEEVLAQVL